MCREKFTSITNLLLYKFVFALTFAGGILQETHVIDKCYVIINGIVRPQPPPHFCIDNAFKTCNLVYNIPDEIKRANANE